MTVVTGRCRALLSWTMTGILWSAAAAAAEDWSQSLRGQAWTVEGKIRKNMDLSGAAMLSPDLGYLVSDETRSVQSFRLDPVTRTLRAGGSVNLLPGVKPELDLEAIAAAPRASCYYAVGSHGVARKSAAVSPDRCWVFRLPVDARTREIQLGRIARATLRPLIAADPVLKHALDRPTGDGGLDIEGLAEKNGVLYFGLRAPSQEGHTFVLEINAQELFGGRSPALRRHDLPLGPGRGVRDIAAIHDGFLLIAGASASGDDAEPEAHGFALYFWPGPGHPPARIGGITHPPGGKAEGLLVRSESDTAIDVLLFYDGAKDGAPTGFTVQKPRPK